jgi:hypothetical protein
MIQKLRLRLAGLERQSSRAPLEKGIDEMSDEELLTCAGLPPAGSDEDIAALVTEIGLRCG